MGLLPLGLLARRLPEGGPEVTFFVIYTFLLHPSSLGFVYTEVIFLLFQNGVIPPTPMFRGGS